MKNNIYKRLNLIAISLAVLLVAIAILLVGAVTVSAIEVNVSANVNANATGTTKSLDKPTAGTQGNATSSSNSGGSQGDANRSEVSLVVKSLLSIADRDGGIGAEVRLVAQEQASTTLQVEESKEGVDSDSGLKVFFFGPDYKNLGKLRSAIVTTENNISRLEKASLGTADASVKADLEVQIAELEVEASSTEAFVKENESKLSLLGWFVRIFVE